MDEKLHSFINFGPIHLKLDFMYISELATYARTLVWSKSLSVFFGKISSILDRYLK